MCGRVPGTSKGDIVQMILGIGRRSVAACVLTEALKFWTQSSSNHDTSDIAPGQMEGRSFLTTRRVDLSRLVHRLTRMADTLTDRVKLQTERMRSMASTRRVRWCVLLAGLVLLVNAHDAPAQPRLACVTIRADESVSSVASRMTGDAINMRAPWFQIVNPTTSRWVPKTRYGLKFAGWNACIVGGPQPDVAIRPTHAVATSSPGGPVVAYQPRAPGARVDSGLLIGGTVLWWTLVLSIALACWGDDYFRKRALVVETMKRFADRFVREFERPLIQQHLPDRPIRSRVRFKPARSRLDVLLSPHSGLRYPNLTDHKRNVIYDVARVEAVLQDRAFVSSQPFARGRWVVVPFHIRVDIREAGGR